MCNKCGNTDQEICTLCDAHYGEEKPGASYVTLDPDTQGELVIKLLDVVQQELVEWQKFVNMGEFKQANVTSGNVQITLGLLNKLSVGKITSEDLDYIDCL